MNKPFGVKVISTVSYIRLVTIVLIVFLMILSTILSSNPFWHGFHDASFKSAGVKNPSAISAYEYGLVIGFYLWPFLFIVLSLFYLKKQKYKALCTVLVIHTLWSFKNIYGLIISVALLVIVFGDDNTKNYLKKIEKEYSSDETSVNIETKVE